MSRLASSILAATFPMLAVDGIAQTLTHEVTMSAQSFLFPTVENGNFRTDTMSTTLEVPQFDPTAGRLVSVSIRHESSVGSTCTVVQVLPVGSAFSQAILDLDYRLDGPSLPTLSAGDSVTDYADVFPRPPTIIHLPQAVPASSTTTLTDTSMQPYIGSGTVTLDLTMQFDQRWTPFGSPFGWAWNFWIDSTETTVYVTYDYAPWWTDEGHALAGTAGEPELHAHGAFGGGMPSALLLHNANPNAPAVLIFGTSRLDLPVFGGVMVPFPEASVPLTIGPTGSYALGFVSSFGPGITMYLQYWIADPSGPEGFAASNAVSGRT